MSSEFMATDSSSLSGPFFLSTGKVSGRHLCIFFILRRASKTTGDLKEKKMKKNWYEEGDDDYRFHPSCC
jgi:hypothetical protein